MDFWVPLPLVCILCKQVPFHIDLISFSPRDFRCFTNLHLWTLNSLVCKVWTAIFPATCIFNSPKSPQDFQYLLSITSSWISRRFLWDANRVGFLMMWKWKWNKSGRRTWGAHVAPSTISSGWISPFLEIPLLCQMSIFIPHSVPFQIGAPGKIIWQPSRLGLFAWNFHWKMFKTCLCDPSSVRSSRNQGATAVARSREVVKA